ncbi:MFS transporter [Sphingomonas sp. LaA6.9]|uniref:MFS transporter n=1 Tax=Sphingomonas sp. LaA6.9 TaxID=2919914 RepID=UPI001F50034F|nr:MFS transporter [Sphingomonas sp. LaA6.9]MCJ8158361.1 MFS transporter [Sphingomonas sp. LaA6.9]
MTSSAAPPYQFKPHERPTLPGSPANPEHPARRMLGYFLVGALAGLTGGLGNALITTNLSFLQGSLGLYSDEAAWLPAVYVMTNICANLLLIKYRMQFGLQPFVRWMLIGYALATLAHLFVHEFWTALLIRAVSGIAASGLTTLSVVYMMQAMPAPKRLAGVMLGISVPQLAIPLARMFAPSLLEWGDWRMAYYFEFGLALATLAAVLTLPLPPSERNKVFERNDFLTVALFFPGVALLCAVLGLGRIVWWTEAPWIGYALIGSIMLIGAALLIEHYRANPLLRTRWIGTREIMRIALIAISVRILLSEQSFGSIGLLSALGMGTDQFQTLYIIVCLASLAGLVAAVVTFKPANPGRSIRVACVLIAIGAFMDANATNLTRPENLYVSQALIGFGALYFIGPAMVIGISRTLLAGPQHFISWIVLFGATQNLGGLIGPAFLGTFQVIRQKFHSHELVEQIVMTNPLVAQRIASGAGAIGGVVTDQTLRAAEGVALLALKIRLEANILAYNDVFMLIGVMACLAFVWGVMIQFRMWRLGEKSPVVRLAEHMQAAMAAVAAEQNGTKREA